MKYANKTKIAIRAGIVRPLLTLRERSIIETRYCVDGWTLERIATAVNKNKSTVSREIGGKPRKGRGRYNADKAHKKACLRIESRGNISKADRHKPLKEYVTEKLKLGWSPEQISGRLTLDYADDTLMQISYEAIYQFVYAQIVRGGNGKVKDGCEDLRGYLPRRHTRRATKGFRKAQKVERAASLPSIEVRPLTVNDRGTIAHWEDDFVVSRDSVPQVKSLNERRSGVHFFRKTKGRTATDGDAQVIACLEKIPLQFRQTLTRDRGSENKGYLLLEEILGISVYFAHPYCSYERGSNENGNGLLRRFFPKGTNWDMISDEELDRAEREINNRPRKRLNWMTPCEFYQKETGVALYS